MKQMSSIETLDPSIITTLGWSMKMERDGIFFEAV